MADIKGRTRTLKTGTWLWSHNISVVRGSAMKGSKRMGKRNGKQRRRATTERPEGLTAERATSQGTYVPQHRCQGTAQAKPNPGLSQAQEKNAKEPTKTEKETLS